MRGPFLRLLSAAGIALKVGITNITAAKSLDINVGAIGPNKLAQISGDGNSLTWIDPASLGGGTVTSVALSAPSIFAVTGSPVTATGTLNLDLTNQPINQIFAGPASGGAGVPAFRALVATDIPSLDAAKIGSGTIAIARLPVGTAAGTLAAGNDSRLHSPNTDTGTTAVSFQVGSGASGPRIKNAGGALEVRNASDNAYADVIVKNLIVQGTTTTVNTEEVTIADNLILLNTNAPATPTEDGGIELSRGTSANAQVLWQESVDRWAVGVIGAMDVVGVKRKFTFVAADLVAGVLTLTHGLNETHPHIAVYFADGFQVFPDIKTTGANTATLDFGGAIPSGTNTIMVVG